MIYLIIHVAKFHEIYDNEITTMKQRSNLFSYLLRKFKIVSKPVRVRGRRTAFENYNILNSYNNTIFTDYNISRVTLPTF